MCAVAGVGRSSKRGSNRGRTASRQRAWKDPLGALGGSALASGPVIEKKPGSSMSCYGCHE